MPTKLLLTILFQIIAFRAMAFDGDQCKLGMAKFGFQGGAFYFTTGITTSQGECALIERLRIDWNKEDKRKREEKKAFVSQNLSSLKEDSAVGKGETLNALADLYACKEESKPKFFQVLNLNYKDIFPDENVDLILTRIDSKVLSDSDLNKNCPM